MAKENAAGTLDFSKFLLAETGTVEINLPNGDPMLVDGQRVTAHVYGPASVEHARASAAVNRKAMERFQAKKVKPMSEDESAEVDAAFLEAVTQRIDNFPYPGGVAAIYRERRLGYIGEQVRAFLNEQGNFYAPSKGN